MRRLFNDTYAIFFSDFLYKSTCCWYSFELLQLVKSIQMSTNNKQKKKLASTHPTDDQEVASSTPAGLTTFFQGDLIMKCHSLPSADSRRAVVSFLQKNVTILVNRLED